MALLTFIATGAYAYYNTNILNEYRTRNASNDDAAEFEKRFWKYHGLPQPTIADVTLDIAPRSGPYPRSLDFIEVFRTEARTAEEQALITDLFERVTLYDLKVTQPTASGT